MKKITVFLLLMASCLVFLPISANAYQVHLGSFQSGYGSTGEIYGNYIPGPNDFFLCLEKQAQVFVPRDYYAYDTVLTGDLLKGAYLMDKYAPSLRGAFGTYSFLETGIAVQNAMWYVTGQGMSFSSGTTYDLAMLMVSRCPTQNCSIFSRLMFA